MSLLEPFLFADSQDVTLNNNYTGARVRSTFLDGSAYSIANGVYSALVDAGWQTYSGTKASWSLVCPSGAPIKGTPITPKIETNVGIAFVKVGGLTYRFYDPGRQTHTTRYDSVWVQEGSTVNESFGNLATAIATTGWVNIGLSQQSGGLYDNWWHQDWEAPVVGLDWNASSLGGLHQVSAAASSPYFIQFIWPVGSEVPTDGFAAANGGIVMRANQDAGYVEVWISIDKYAPHYPLFEVRSSQSGGEQNPRIRIWPGYGKMTCIANQFQFFLFREGVDPNSDPAGRHQLMVSFPYLRTAKGVTYAAVVAGWHTFRTAMQWEGATRWGASAVNSGFSRWLRYEYGGTGPGLYPVRYRPALQTPGDGPLFTSAYLGATAAYPSGASGQARLVGYLWDALILNEDAPIDQRRMWGNRLYQCVGRNITAGYQATQATLWVAYEDVS